MCEIPDERPLERVNPFVEDTPDTPFEDICATYNASFRISGEIDSIQDQSQSHFERDILDDYFDEPLIHVDSKSSIDELESAIFRLKHMVLASANETVERRQRLLDRLIELRRILHTLKDSNNSQQESSDGFSHGPPTSIPIPSTGSFTPLIRRVRTGSQHSLTVHGCSPERSRRSKRSASPTRSTGGHEFKLTLAFRYLGQSCEYCRRVIRDPSRRILTCSQCPVVCHPQHCLRGLTRRCPCSLMSSDFYSSLKPLPSIQTKSHTGTDTANPMAPAQFRHLEVHCLCYLGANLTDQCWSCFECRKPLRPAPNSTVAAEPSMVSPFVQTTDCVMESTANLLMRQAASAETNPDAMLKWVTPQLRTQVDSLWDHTAQVLSHHPKFTVPTDDTGPHLQWAYADAQTDLGPIQTWADAVVLEAVHRVSRTDNSSSNPTSISANHLRAPLLLNGEVVKPQSQTDSGSVCPIGNTFEQLDQARLCYYTGQFYCTQCHWGDSHLIPACLFTLGDYRPKPVCRSALLWLRYTWSRHLFRVPDSWYRYEPQAQVVAALRIRLFRCKPYVDSCDQARIVWTELNSHEPYWIFEQPYTFTMELASYVIDGTFAPKLKNYLRTFDEHVRSCPSCENAVPSQCSVCHNGPIRPYEALGAFCSNCRLSCHRSCLACPLPVLLDPTTNTTASPTLPSPDEAIQISLSQTDSNDNYLLEVLYPAMRTVCLSCSQGKI